MDDEPTPALEQRSVTSEASSETEPEETPAPEVLSGKNVDEDLIPGPLADEAWV